MFNHQVLLVVILSILLGCNKATQTTHTDDGALQSESSSFEDWAEFTINDLIFSNNVWGKGSETNYFGIMKKFYVYVIQSSERNIYS